MQAYPAQPEKHVAPLWEWNPGIPHDLFEMDEINSTEQGETQKLPILKFSWNTKINFLTIVKSIKEGRQKGRNEDFEDFLQKGKIALFSMLGKKSPKSA